MQLCAPFWDEGVEFVEENDAGDGGAGALEDLAEGAFGFADVLQIVSESAVKPDRLLYGE